MVELEQILRSRGYRLTNQRRAIVRELENGRHLSAEEMYEHLRGDHPELGLSTVYRTLDLLTELGVARKDDFGEGYSRYELATERMHHHARKDDFGEGYSYGRCAECAANTRYREHFVETTISDGCTITPVRAGEECGRVIEFNEELMEYLAVDHNR